MRIPSAAWKTTPVCLLGCKNWWPPWQVWLWGGYRGCPIPGSLHPGCGNTARPYLRCRGFPSPCQLDGKVPTSYEPRGESVDAWPTGLLGSSPGSRNCPVPPHYNPDYGAWAKHGVERDIPDSYTSLFPMYSGQDRGHFLWSEHHSSLFTVQVRSSRPGWADNGLYLHLPV